ncbi:hypothetical protein PHSY_001390 [Pseudozyma hubeiensis SY62]|uniref:Uncharacterized protein n=1 Tax=Pseudozyma hubeiensis (strain SY62) TaxID=1305764 RepID=R9P6Y6_PSEHS|nr:hypothetical protein PHSY_001390 [Pseudozyma hubeiensis SY62]GAC93825.1 hypothetical protein PHSY_001390 [Pseudozyma hubeiensis SY62]
MTNVSPPPLLTERIVAQRLSARSIGASPLESPDLLAVIMGEPGRTCACTPRSLLVPAGGVSTLDPSQRVSAKELQARDRQWQRQRNKKPTQQTVKPRTSLGSTFSEATLRDDEGAPLPSGTKTKKKGLLSMFGRKDDKETNANG